MRARIADQIGWRLAPLVCLWALAGQASAADTQLAAAEGAGPTLTLQALLDQAMQRSPGVQAKKRAYEAVRARVLSAWLPDDPMIGADVEGQSSLWRPLWGCCRSCGRRGAGPI